jgi:hypothetical protein
MLGSWALSTLGHFRVALAGPLDDLIGIRKDVVGAINSTYGRSFHSTVQREGGNDQSFMSSEVLAAV